MTLGAAAGGEAATVAVAVWPLSGPALTGALPAEHAAPLTMTSKPILTSMPFALMILRTLLPPALFPRPVMLMSCPIDSPDPPEVAHAVACFRQWSGSVPLLGWLG